MSCKQHHDALTAAALGEAREPAFARHLSECAACQTTLDDTSLAVARMDGDIQVLLSASPAADFTARVTTRALADSEHRPWIYRAAAVAACAAVVVAVTTGLGLFGRTSRVTQPEGAGLVASVPSAEVASERATEATDQPLTRTPGAKRIIRQRTAARPHATSARAGVEHEVLVQPGQRQAVERLVTAVAERRFTLEEPLQIPAGPIIVPVPMQQILIEAIEMRDVVAAPKPAFEGGE